MRHKIHNWIRTAVFYKKGEDTSPFRSVECANTSKKKRFEGVLSETSRDEDTTNTVNLNSREKPKGEFKHHFYQRGEQLNKKYGVTTE